MKLAQSRITAQGQVSVPAAIRRRLGLATGSIIEWDAVGDNVVVRRAGRYSSQDVHRTLFPDGAPGRQPLAALTEGIRRAMRERHARR